MSSVCYKIHFRQTITQMSWCPVSTQCVHWTLDTHLSRKLGMDKLFLKINHLIQGRHYTYFFPSLFHSIENHKTLFWCIKALNYITWWVRKKTVIWLRIWAFIGHYWICKLISEGKRCHYILFFDSIYLLMNFREFSIDRKKPSRKLRFCY